MVPTCVTSDKQSYKELIYSDQRRVVSKKTAVIIFSERATSFLVQYQKFRCEHARGLSNLNGVNLWHFRWKNCKELIYGDKRGVVKKKTAAIIFFERARIFCDQNASKTERICPQTRRLPHPKLANEYFLAKSNLRELIDHEERRGTNEKDCYNFAFWKS